MLAPLTALGMTAALALSPTLAPGTPPPPAPPSCAHPTIVGTDGDDTIVGTEGDDVIDAGRGDDVVHGLGGNDTICGGRGDDQLDGGPGDDQLDGGDNRDVITGGSGSDTEWGGSGSDRLYTRDVTPSPADPTSVDALYGGYNGGDVLTMDAGTAQLWAEKGYNRIVVRGRPGAGTILSHADVTVVPGPAPTGGRTVAVDFRHGTIDLDGGQAQLINNQWLPITVDATATGSEPTRVVAEGSHAGGDTLNLVGVESATTHLNGGSNYVTVTGGHIRRMDLDLGSPDDGQNLLTLLPDVDHVVVDLPAQSVSLNGRPILHLKGVARVGVGDRQLPDAAHSSIVMRGFPSRPNYLVAGAFHDVSITGGSGNDFLVASDIRGFGLPAVPPSRAVIDGGAGADKIQAYEAAGSMVRLKGGPGQDIITSGPAAAVIHGGTGADRCYTDATADCELAAPYRERPPYF